MPKESLNIYLTAVDKMSPALASITDKTKALDKESQQLQHTYESLQRAQKALIDRKVELEGKLKAVNEAVKEARKNFKLYGDEASSDAYKKAQQEQQKLRDEIAATSKALTENRKIYKENIETIRKDSLSDSGGLGEQMGAVLGKLGIGQQLSQLAQQAGEAVLGSTFGDEMGNALGTALSGAISGAALGSAIAPGLGTAVGAALGGASGLVSGGIQAAQARDDAFKDYYGGLYQDVSARTTATVEAGSTIAGGRERDQISFSTLFNSEDKAEKYLAELVEMANTTPFLYDDLTAMSKTLATYGYNDRTILPQLQVIGDTGAALGMSTSDMSMVATALGRMKSSDKTTLEYLNILNDRGIGAVGMLADAKGVSVGDMYKMISDGKVSGRETVQIITDALKELYSGSMLKQSQTFEGISSTLEGLTQELQNAAGEGYITLRTEGKREEVNALSGDLGDAMKEINTIIGENQARKENLEAQYQREALDAVLNGRHGALWGKIDEDSQGKLDAMHNELLAQKAKLEESREAGDEEGAALASAKIEALYEEAQATGKALFDNSEFVKALNETEQDEIQAIRDNTAGLTEATKAAYELAQQLSKGVWSSAQQEEVVQNALAVAGQAATGDVEGAAASLAGTDPNGPGQANPAAGVIDFFSYVGNAVAQGNAIMEGRSHGYGLRRVPFDGYPALLHEGERVLTKSEAEHALMEDGPRLGAEPETETLALGPPRGAGPTEQGLTVVAAPEEYPPLPLRGAPLDGGCRRGCPHHHHRQRLCGHRGGDGGPAYGDPDPEDGTGLHGSGTVGGGQKKQVGPAALGGPSNRAEPLPMARPRGRAPQTPREKQRGGRPCAAPSY